MVEQLTAHTWGLQMLFPFFALTGLKFVFPQLVTIPDFVTKTELTTAYQAFRIPAIEAKALGYDDAIFLNNLNFVSETTAASIFMVKDNLIITPPLNAGILDSITRKNIISLAHSKNISVIERNITRVELYTADEIFIAGTLCEITPVLQIDKTIIGGGEVGQITKSMIDTYIGICEGNIKDEWGWLEYVE